MPSWDMPDFADAGWRSVVVGTSPELAPSFVLNEGEAFGWEPESGHADHSGTALAYSVRAREIGVSVVLESPARDIEIEGGRVAAVTTSTECYETPIAVVSAYKIHRAHHEEQSRFDLTGQVTANMRERSNVRGAKKDASRIMLRQRPSGCTWRYWSRMGSRSPNRSRPPRMWSCLSRPSSLPPTSRRWRLQRVVPSARRILKFPAPAVTSPRCSPACWGRR